MPRYDYRCAESECREEFEVERSMSDPTETTCSKCGSANVSRIWNMFIRTKGSTPDVGQKSSSSSSSGTRSGGCGSCSTHSCGTCH
ncbi:MAG: zinc ribbon domain-containing protein [Candidatus Melainabacteria bacterium]|jgi:putative FmdB family regulatory protein|nr:zinc ribbon domain-containing protein [Candidatus Melainabacteria bacterium]MBX9673120.1 zinc ribbon domain-containing protein [Candidatus Obscuribacterales bacterium]